MTATNRLPSLDAFVRQVVEVANHQNWANASLSHLSIRIDALPPWSDPNDRYYWCPTCGFLTGVEQRTAAIPHEIPDPDRVITAADLPPRIGEP